jgi:hypothetical protein
VLPAEVVAQLAHRFNRLRIDDTRRSGTRAVSFHLFSTMGCARKPPPSGSGSNSPHKRITRVSFGHNYQVRAVHAPSPKRPGAAG